jgi:hypothetical protein
MRIEFIKIGSSIQKLIGGRGLQTLRQHGDQIGLLSYFQNKERRLLNINHWTLKD